MMQTNTLLFVTFVVGVKVMDCRTLHPYIVGGDISRIQNFPHQVSLKYQGVHFCGGSIYKSNIIITAAHCLEFFSDVWLEDVAVAAGSSFRDRSAQLISVKDYIIHEKYDQETYDNDIGILVLDGNLQFNERVQPIDLSTKRPPSGSKVTASGWGYAGRRQYFFGFLQQVEIEVVDQNECFKKYSRVSHPITESMLCAGSPYGGMDACKGDSGGPLTYKNELLGVISFGYGCGYKAFPGVYASIPDLHDWILNAAVIYEEK